MTDALEETFGNVLVEDGEDRKRRRRLLDPAPTACNFAMKQVWKPWRSPLAGQRPRVVYVMPGFWFDDRRATIRFRSIQASLRTLDCAAPARSRPACRFTRKASENQTLPFR